jgi:hypothetical protein
VVASPDLLKNRAPIIGEFKGQQSGSYEVRIAESIGYSLRLGLPEQQSGES